MPAPAKSAAAFDVATRVLTGIGSLEALPGELAGLNASTDHPFRRNNGRRSDDADTSELLQAGTRSRFMLTAYFRTCLSPTVPGDNRALPVRSSTGQHEQTSKVPAF
jgi:hypothetical protein